MRCRQTLATAIFGLATVLAHDVAVAGNRSSPPVIIAANLSDRDYPKDALAGGIEGDVVAHFTVDLSGKVEQCTHESTVGAAILGDRSCELLSKRFRYKAATDSSGRSVVASLNQSFAWRIKGRCPNLGPSGICITAPKK
jgi:periplasmic protein TonB